jgi:hypothetical protein
MYVPNSGATSFIEKKRKEKKRKEKKRKENKGFLYSHFPNPRLPVAYFQIF